MDANKEQVSNVMNMLEPDSTNKLITVNQAPTGMDKTTFDQTLSSVLVHDVISRAPPDPPRAIAAHFRQACTSPVEARV